MRFAQMATRVFGCNMDFADPKRTAREGVAAFKAFLREIGMPLTFAEIGAKPEDIEDTAFTVVEYTPVSIFERIRSDAIESVTERPPLTNTIYETIKASDSGVLLSKKKRRSSDESIVRAKNAADTHMKFLYLSQMRTQTNGPTTANTGARMVSSFELPLESLPTSTRYISRLLLTAK